MGSDNKLMHKLRKESEKADNEERICFHTTHKKNFAPVSNVPSEVIGQTFEFAYLMTFGGGGKHRIYRSGGQEGRRQGEIFRDTFQGKLAEFCLHQSVSEIGIRYEEPGLETWDLGRWDMGDAEINGKQICVKSAKFFANLLLLETKDWDQNGEYVPNKNKEGTSLYDLFVLIRLKPSLDSILKEKRMLYSDSVDESELKKLVVQQNWEYDSPGFITHDQLVSAIGNEFILPQNSYLNGTTKMDAENYYIQTGDMFDFQNIIDYLQKKSTKLLGGIWI